MANGCGSAGFMHLVILLLYIFAIFDLLFPWRSRARSSIYYSSLLSKSSLITLSSLDLLRGDFFRSRMSLCVSTDSTFQLNHLVISGDICPNPGPSKKKKNRKEKGVTASKFK